MLLRKNLFCYFFKKTGETKITLNFLKEHERSNRWRKSNRIGMEDEKNDFREDS